MVGVPVSGPTVTDNPASLEAAEELRRIAKDAEEEAARHHRDVQERLREIERANAIRDANYQRRLKEIDYENKKLQWNAASERRARDEAGRKQDEQNRIATITQENHRLVVEREANQKARDAEYRREQEADSDRRKRSRNDEYNDVNWGPTSNVAGRGRGEGSSGSLMGR